MTNYAPVDRFSAIAFESDVIEGLAYPMAGPLCCAVAFRSGKRLLGVSRASAFSSKAHELGIRHGWCKFRFMFLPQHFIFEDVVTLECYVSGKFLGNVSENQLSWQERVNRKTRSVAELMNYDLAQDSVTDIESYRSLLAHAAETLSATDYIILLYRFLLGREPDPAGVQVYVNSLEERGDPFALATAMATSEEALKLRGRSLPTPFGSELGIGFEFRKLSNEAP